LSRNPRAFPTPRPSRIPIATGRSQTKRFSFTMGDTHFVVLATRKRRSSNFR
jgi:hypothetical protein